MTTRRDLLATAPALLAPHFARGAGQDTTASSPGTRIKILRYALPSAETSLDPAQISDLYSRILTDHIFDAPYEFDYLARPPRLKPNVAAAMPKVSADFRSFVVTLRPGIFFADDPAFKGARRELVAQDFVYAFQRHYDPRWKSPVLYVLEKAKLVGMDEMRKRAQKSGRFDYDQSASGLRALDRYTFQMSLAEPDPRFVYQLADGSIFGAVAREVVEHYGDEIAEHPVGTGPFRLTEWRRSSRIVMEKNPNYRVALFDAEPPADDPGAQAIAARLRGRRLPMVDRVEVSIIEESQPRWLSFLANEHDLLDGIPTDFANLAVPNGVLAPNLARHNIALDRTPDPSVTMIYFNMEDAALGGYTPERVALRRAIALAYDNDAEIRLIRRGQGIPAQGPMVPLAYGYAATLRTEMSLHDPVRANALLDLFGYLDRDGDGWREQPDGKPLMVEYYNQPDGQSRQYSELWQRCLTTIKVRTEIKIGQWPEQLKQARAGKLMAWALGYSATTPDNDEFLAFCYSPDSGEGNLARFHNAEFDALYRRQHAMPDGPERFALMQQLVKYMLAYMPYKFNVHRFYNSLIQPWLIGYRRHAFMRRFWHLIDIDADAQARASR